MSIDMQVVPYNQERFIGNQEKVTLYFVGAEYWAAHKGLPPPLNIKGDEFRFPDLGESVTLRASVAKDVAFKTRYKGRNAFVRKEEGGDKMAAMLKKAIANGQDPSELNLEKLHIRQVTSELSDEEVMALARSRNLLPPDELVEEVTANKTEDNAKRVSPPPSKGSK